MNRQTVSKGTRLAIQTASLLPRSQRPSILQPLPLTTTQNSRFRRYYSIPHNTRDITRPTQKPQQYKYGIDSQFPLKNGHQLKSQDNHQDNDRNEGSGGSSTNYYVSVGKATIAIQHELEDFLHNGIQDLTVYHSQIKFREPTHTDLKINGVSAYLMLWRFVRFSLITYYTDPILIVTSLKQIPLTRSQKDSQDSGGDESSTLSPGNEGEKDGNGDDDGSGGVIKEPPDQEPHNNTPTNNKNDKDNNIKEIMLSVRWIFEGKPLLSSEISQFEGHFRYGFDPKTGLINYHEFVGIYPNPTASFLARFSWPSSSSGSSPSSPSV